MLMCIAMWVYRIRESRHTGSLLESRAQKASPIGIVDIGVTVMIWMTFVATVTLLLTVVFGFKLTPGESASAADTMQLNGILMLAQLAATFVAIGYFLMRHGKVQWLGQRVSLRQDLLVGATASLMLIPLVMLIQAVVTQWIDYKHETLDSLVENFTGPTAFWAWIAAVVVAPVTEEFFFRGLIQGWLQRTFDHKEPLEAWFIGGRVAENSSKDLRGELPFQTQLRFWTPIVITSVLFAAVHLGQGPAPIPLFFLSLGLGYVFRKTGSFIPCIFIHFVLNALSLTLLTLGIMYPELMPQEIESAHAYIR